MLLKRNNLKFPDIEQEKNLVKILNITINSLKQYRKNLLVEVQSRKFIFLFSLNLPIIKIITNQMNQLPYYQMKKKLTN